MFSTSPEFRSPSAATERRVDDLVGRLTLDEKLSLLGGQPHRGATFAVERLGIPELKMSDGPMGVHWWCSHATAYPALFNAAAAWDHDLWQRLGRSLGRDARARGVHILLAPGVNICRSPLCGRNFEYAGEDPYLAAQTAVGFIRGVQSQRVSCTVKHFAVNFQEYNRHHVSSDLDERTLHEIYLPAFEAAIKDAGAGALMTAYNLVNGVHCSEHPGLLRDVLKGQWQFDGLVMSDWVSTYSAERAANAGLDLEMPSALWLNASNLLPLLESGEVSSAVVDDKVRRLLRLAVCFGWLDHEQLDESIALDDPESNAVALEVARSGCVLLKNDFILPFDVGELKSLAVLGPYAHPAVFSGGGSAYTTPFASTSVLDGLRDLVGGDVRILHARGPEPNPERLVFSTSRFNSELGKGLRGEYFDNGELAGEPAIVRLDEHVDFTWGASAPAPEISVANYSARWRGTIQPSEGGRHWFYSRSHDSEYRVTLDGVAIIDTWNGERNGLHTKEVLLESGREYAIEIAWKKTRYWGGMQFGWENVEHRGLELAECAALAEQAQAAILCVGFDNVSEGEGFDRAFEMNEQLVTLVRGVAKVQPNTVVVLTAGGNVEMASWLGMVKAVLFVGFPGQQGGRAIAEILFGLVNPSGKLPVTFEKRLEDRSSFESYHDEDHDERVQLSDGVFTGYRYADRQSLDVLYPFGFGLSYTRFEYGMLSLSSHEIRHNEALQLTVEVTNVGSRSGAEVVQVYVRDCEASLPRPIQELKGFAKVQLEPGERRAVQVTLEPRAFAFYDVARHDWVTEPGDFEIRVGSSSRDLRGALMVRLLHR
ncbi:MAG TPA: glycoside hydrolase family 3 C-terminal domain-containing protein [Polyangiaceae bacterium]